MSNLEEYRSNLDQVDEQIMNLLKTRIHLIKDIKELKYSLELNAYQENEHARRTQLFESYATKHHLSVNHFTQLYHTLHQIALDIQD
jgi:chorismate mutase